MIFIGQAVMGGAPDDTVINMLHVGETRKNNF